MRKPNVGAADRIALAGRRESTPTELVCLALALAIAVLATRIASIW
jgi:hypothetical protein